MSKYSCITIFTKKGNLMPYIQLARDPMLDPSSDYAHNYYGKEREIQLVLATRYERTPNGNKLMCKISCPVNPIPVKGEFEAPSYAAICSFMKSQGWTKKETFSNHWFE